MKKLVKEGFANSRSAVHSSIVWDEAGILELIKKAEEHIPKNGKSLLPDDAWLEQIKSLFPHVKFEQEMNKMRAWLMAKPDRKLTRQFIANWLNRIEVPLEGAYTKKLVQNIAPMTAWQIKEAIEGCQTTISNIRNLEDSWHTVKNQYGIDERQLLHSARVKIKNLKDRIVDLEELKSRL